MLPEDLLDPPAGARAESARTFPELPEGGESGNMSNLSERRLGYGFGLLGGGLILLGSLVSLFAGMVDLALGRPSGAISAGSLAIVLFVIGGLALFFAWLARHDWADRPLPSGVLMVVIAVLGWGFLGLGGNVVSLVGAIFVFVGGLLFLVEPAKTVVTSVVAA